MSVTESTGEALRSSLFRRRREASWRELEDLVERIETRGLGAAGPAELERLPLLYRSTLSSLAVARSIALDRNLLGYLENLSLRAFIAVHRPRESMLDGFKHFLVVDFPQSVRAARWHLALAFATIVLGTIVGYALTMSDEAWYTALIPEWLAGSRGINSTREELMTTELFRPWEGIVDSFIIFANALFQHNALVGILAFGLGVIGGVPTLLLIAYQGLILGAMLALHANRGLTVEFLGWVSIHGVTEIAAILLSGAAGLMVAEKILVPGTFGRLETLAMAGRAAARVMAGAALMFLLAGVIEGGLRQAIASTGWRFAFAAFTAILWAGYFGLAGRARSSGP